MNVGKVKLNLIYYSGKDNYSDGAIEEEILELATSQKDIEKIVEQDKRWPILYHFSLGRKNLLDWYSFDKSKNLLEIGSGCGALTGLFSEKTNHVTCVELSKMRSMVNANRNSEKDNIEIMVGNFEDIKLEGTFDYVTLIGVLEYAPAFIISSNPALHFLELIKKYMTPEGELIIAIENRFGLKYWAGAKEDHTGIMFDGLQNYVHSDGVVTFSKKEISELLQQAGFTDIKFYYPYPDYKLPNQIFSDNRLPLIGELRNVDNYDQSRVDLFDEGIVFDALVNNQQFPLSSNSFLIIAKQ